MKRLLRRIAELDTLDKNTLEKMIQQIVKEGIINPGKMENLFRGLFSAKRNMLSYLREQAGVVPQPYINALNKVVEMAQASNNPNILAAAQQLLQQVQELNQQSKTTILDAEHLEKAFAQIIEATNTGWPDKLQGYLKWVQDQNLVTELTGQISEQTKTKLLEYFRTLGFHERQSMNTFKNQSIGPVKAYLGSVHTHTVNPQLIEKLQNVFLSAEMGVDAVIHWLSGGM